MGIKEVLGWGTICPYSLSPASDSAPLLPRCETLAGYLAAIKFGMRLLPIES